MGTANAGRSVTMQEILKPDSYDSLSRQQSFQDWTKENTTYHWSFMSLVCPGKHPQSNMSLP